MLASSLFVLSALTLTGVYVKERTKIQNENSVDFSQMENSATEKAAENQKQEAEAEANTIAEAEYNQQMEMAQQEAMAQQELDLSNGF